MRCNNPRCRDRCEGRLCPSCRYMGKMGIFAGGVLVGVVVAVLKLCKLL